MCFNLFWCRGDDIPSWSLGYESGMLHKKPTVNLKEKERMLNA